VNVNESTKKFFRTLYQGILALIVVVPTLVALLPTSAGRIATIGAAVAGAVAVAAKVVNALEDKGAIPAWLRQVDSTTVTKTVTTAVEEPASAPSDLLDYGDAGRSDLDTAMKLAALVVLVLVAALLLADLIG
jgi:hypothetical protein